MIRRRGVDQPACISTKSSTNAHDSPNSSIIPTSSPLGCTRNPPAISRHLPRARPHISACPGITRTKHVHNPWKRPRDQATQWASPGGRRNRSHSRPGRICCSSGKAARANEREGLSGATQPHTHVRVLASSGGCGPCHSGDLGSGQAFPLRHLPDALTGWRRAAVVSSPKSAGTAASDATEDG